MEHCRECFSKSTLPPSILTGNIISFVTYQMETGSQLVTLNQLESRTFSSYWFCGMKIFHFAHVSVTITATVGGLEATLETTVTLGKF